MLPSGGLGCIELALAFFVGGYDVVVPTGTAFFGVFLSVRRSSIVAVNFEVLALAVESGKLVAAPAADEAIKCGNLGCVEMIERVRR